MKERLTWRRVILLLPALAFFALFALVPMVVAVYLSFLKWDGVNAASFVGAVNWEKLFTDPLTGMSVVLTLKVMVITWAIQTPLSLLIGVFLAGKQRHRAILGVFYFLPLLFSSAATALAWTYILNPNFGLLNAVLTQVGLPSLAQDWTGDPNLALFTVIGVIMWQFVPFHSLLYQAGTRQIPATIFEAAEIDGATGVKRFFLITLPQLKYTFTTSTVLMVTGSLTYFDLFFIMTQGGPGYSTTILPLYMYKTAFSDNQLGYGSVLAVVLATAGILISILTLKFTGFNKMDSQMEGI